MFSFLKKNSTYDNPEFLEQVNNLNERKDDPIARIALNDLRRTEILIDRASSGNEVLITDMYAANRIPLSMLNEGDDFFGVSALIHPLDWAHDEGLQEYKKVNEQQAAKGVNIERTFVLQSERDIANMRVIMDEQSKAGISVRYVIEDELKSLSYFPDFTIMPKFNLVLYVPNLHNIKSCIATRDEDLMKDILKDYDSIQRYAMKWNYNG